MRTVPISILLAGALLAAGCATSPAPSGSGGQTGSAGSGSSAPAAQPPAASAGTPGAGAAGDPPAGKADGATPASAGPSGGSAAAGPGQTTDERRAAIDKRLDDSLGSFDSQLRNEQQRVAQERDTRQTAAAGSASTEGQGAGKGADAAGTASTEGPAGEGKGNASGRHGGPSHSRDHSGDLKSERASHKSDDNAGNGASAREIPDGSDDDVVARRLRQAAEQETDPELKEKLWKEYIDYKKNVQGK